MSLYMDCLTRNEAATSASSNNAEMQETSAKAKDLDETWLDAPAELPLSTWPALYVMLCHYSFQFPYGCVQVAWGEQLRFVAPGGSELLWLQQLSSGARVCVPEMMASRLTPWGRAALGARARVVLQYSEPAWHETPSPRFEVGEVVVLMEHVTEEMSLAFVRQEDAELAVPVRVPLMILTCALPV